MQTAEGLPRQLPLRFTQAHLNGPQRRLALSGTRSTPMSQRTATQRLHQFLAPDSHRLHFFSPSACTWKEPWAKTDTEAHGIIVANDKWLTVKLTPDLETNCNGYWILPSGSCLLPSGCRETLQQSGETVHDDGTRRRKLPTWAKMI